MAAPVPTSVKQYLSTIRNAIKDYIRYEWLNTSAVGSVAGSDFTLAAPTADEVTHADLIGRTVTATTDGAPTTHTITAIPAVDRIIVTPAPPADASYTLDLTSIVKDAAAKEVWWDAESGVPEVLAASDTPLLIVSSEGTTTITQKTAPTPEEVFPIRFELVAEGREPDRIENFLAQVRDRLYRGRNVRFRADPLALLQSAWIGSYTIDSLLESRDDSAPTALNAYWAARFELVCLIRRPTNLFA